MAACGCIMSSESPFYHHAGMSQSKDVTSTCFEFTFTNQTDVFVEAPRSQLVCHGAFIHLGCGGTAMQIPHIIKPSTDQDGLWGRSGRTNRVSLRDSKLYTTLSQTVWGKGCAECQVNTSWGLGVVPPGKKWCNMIVTCWCNNTTPDANNDSLKRLCYCFSL